MAPLPKRKHSKARKGARILERKKEKSLPALVLCKNCGKRKLPHQKCKFCNSTENTAAVSLASNKAAETQNAQPAATE
ncbi:MAG TPA: 50S ribosomal protein L32 [Candidatus Woesebacteria bacterium]|nr:50S ribosomal protein L32 [Candidatus Woesebacteria bacterium]